MHNISNLLTQKLSYAICVLSTTLNDNVMVNVIRGRNAVHVPSSYLNESYDGSECRRRNRL